MARFRLLVIISAVWLTLVFNIERPDFDFIGLTNLDLDSVTYVVAALAALVILWLPDLSRRTELVFPPALLLYFGMRLTIGRAVTPGSFPLMVLEIVVIYITVVIFQRISRALLSFENTVDNVLLRPDDLRVLTMDEGIERVDDEISRARRFNRSLGIILLRIDYDNLEDADIRFDLEQKLMRHYTQLRVAQVAEMVLYKIDLVMLYKADVLVCMPETSAQIVERKAKQLAEEIEWRLGQAVSVGSVIFPDDGYVLNDLIDKATIRLHESRSDMDDVVVVDDDDIDDDTDDRSTTISAEHHSRPQPEHNETVSLQKSMTVKQPQNLLDRYQSFWTKLFNPWPNVIEMAQRQERLARTIMPGSSESVLHHPSSWVGVLPYQTNGSRRVYLPLKRAIDIIAVLIAMPLVLPVMAAVALLIWLEDRGPIFFRQQRTGYGGQRFEMFKFRTMVPNAEELLQDLAAKGLAKLDENGKLAEPLKMERDPRVTRIGWVLRKTSLDELPQLFNVLRGDMSLVGPRPTSWDLDSYRLFHTERLQVLPGITGLWQVGARGSTNFNEWVDWDRTYVEKMSLVLDVQILVRTFAKVFVGKGAR